MCVLFDDQSSPVRGGAETFCWVDVIDKVKDEDVLLLLLLLLLDRTLGPSLSVSAGMMFSKDQLH